MRDAAYPKASDKDSTGRSISYECLGDLYPEVYRFPPDLDVLGDLPSTLLYTVQENAKASRIC